MSTTETATQQIPGINRTDLQQHDLSAPGREVVQHRVELSREAPPIRHKHPGEEIIYVLEGSLEYQVDGSRRRSKQERSFSSRPRPSMR